MGQVRHGSATTTHAVRAAIQRSQASLAQLSRELGINPKTVAKWRKPLTVEDMKTGPTEPRSTVLTEAEEAMIVAFRWALLRNSCLRHEGPFPLRHQATRTISAVPRAEKRFIRAMRIWISAVWRSGSLALMRSPNALRHRIFALIRLWAWYPVQRFQNALP